jgi:ubiquinone/menaquinone biosynthesis C-methylase UbiE
MNYIATVAPIFVMSFNRPDYLGKVLESLRAQIDCDLEQRTIILFQDGAINPYSNEQHASEKDINDCIGVFQRLFPDKPIVRSPANLGVALNFDRAERYGFEKLAADAIIFLEDDLVLNQRYLVTLDSLIEMFAKDQRVGYVAAYGDHTSSIEDQRAHRERLIGLTHNWGFALYRRQWLRMRPYVLQYLNLVRDVDYHYKDAKAICELFASWGFGCPAISQDAAKTIACCRDNVIKINTYACNATYIGERGLHMNPRIFSERGYEKTVLYGDRLDNFEKLDDRRYQILNSEQRNWALSMQVSLYPGKDASMDGSKRVGPTTALKPNPTTSRLTEAGLAANLSHSWQNADFEQQWKIAEPQVKKMKNGEHVDVFDSFIAIMRYIPNNKRYSFLDCACALGYYYDVIKHRLDHEIDYTGTDFAENAVTRAKAHHPSVTWKKEDLTALSFADTTFDIVLGSGVLEHVPAWELALLNITRVASSYVILHRLPISETGCFIRGQSQQYGITTARNSFSFYQVVLFMASRHFAIVNSLDTYGTYKIPEQTMLFRRMIGSGLNE